LLSSLRFLPFFSPPTTFTHPSFRLIIRFPCVPATTPFVRLGPSQLVWFLAAAASNLHHTLVHTTPTTALASAHHPCRFAAHCNPELHQSIVADKRDLEPPRTPPSRSRSFSHICCGSRPNTSRKALHHHCLAAAHSRDPNKPADFTALLADKPNASGTLLARTSPRANDQVISREINFNDPFAGLTKAPCCRLSRLPSNLPYNSFGPIAHP